MHNIKKQLLVIILAVTCIGNASAQSHYSLSWEREGILGGIGLATAITGDALASNLKAPTLSDISAFPLQRNNVNRFDRGAIGNWSESLSTSSDVLVLALAATPAVLMLSEDMKKDYLTIGFMYGETLWFSVFTSSIAKGGVKRVRPYAYNPSVPIDKKTIADTRASFFSGHTVVAFASMSFFATVYNEYYPDSKYLPWIVGGGLVASSVAGVLRIESGNHFPTDVLAGAVVGTAFGYIIPALHKGDSNVRVTPALIDSNPGVTLSLVF